MNTSWCLTDSEHSTDLPEVYGSGLLVTLLHLCLHGWYTYSQSHTRRACASPPDFLYPFSSYGLVINTDKCQFDVSTLNFLGHCNSSAGITPLEDYVEAICNFPATTSKTSLKEYLGLISFYLHFYPHCAEVYHPLYQFLKGKITPWIWTPTYHISGHISSKAKRPYKQLLFWHTLILQHLCQSPLNPQMLLLVLFWNNNLMANGPDILLP